MSSHVQVLQITSHWVKQSINKCSIKRLVRISSKYAKSKMNKSYPMRYAKRMAIYFTSTTHRELSALLALCDRKKLAWWTQSHGEDLPHYTITCVIFVLPNYQQSTTCGHWGKEYICPYLSLSRIVFCLIVAIRSTQCALFADTNATTIWYPRLRLQRLVTFLDIDICINCGMYTGECSEYWSLTHC